MSPRIFVVNTNPTCKVWKQKKNFRNKSGRWSYRWVDNFLFFYKFLSEKKDDQAQATTEAKKASSKAPYEEKEKKT